MAGSRGSGGSVSGSPRRQPDQTTYYQRLVEILGQYRDSENDKDRAYVSALSLCFDSEQAPDTPLAEICSTHTFSLERSTHLAFVLARNQLIEFCVTELALPEISGRRIRNATRGEFVAMFGRDPHEYGQSDMWCTLAEWYLLLGLGRPPALPQTIRDFAYRNDVRLPR